MKKIFISLISLIFLYNIGKSQLITTIPSFPTDNDSVIITFDATQGNAGLKGYTGDVYAHTGVITNLSASSDDWKYVKAAWGVNIPICKMTRIATDKYQLKISPSIRQFYNVSVSEKIIQMAFVFRSSDVNGTYQGKGTGNANIFSTVYTTGLNINFTLPTAKFTMADSNQLIHITINAIGNDSIALFLDGNKIKSVIGQILSDSIYAKGYDIHKLKAFAYKDTLVVSDSVFYFVHGHTANQTLPAKLKDGINYSNDSTVTFVLFAPYKNYIYLLGDFNHWQPDSNFLMKRDSNRFWLTVNHLTPGKEYIFQYLIDGNIRIADPYCEKISDPANDVNISSKIYPNLIPYPLGKTTDIAGVIQTAQTPYNWQTPNFVPPTKNNLVVYELLIRDFTANKDIKTVTDSIAYFKRLGINAIELMPFSEFDGNDSWGYNPSFYFAPDKAYGTKDDYKKFVDVCHQNGIAVIQDMVLDFSTGNSPLVRMYFENGAPSAQNPWYNVKSNLQNTSLVFGYDFNHDSPYTRKLIDSITSFWMTQYNIDGFRMDFTKGWSNTPYGASDWASAYDTARIKNLKLMASHVWQVKPSAYVICEHFADNSEETVLANYGLMLWGNLNSAYCQAAMSYNDAGGSWDLSWISFKNRGWKNPNVMGYMESHDEQRAAYKCEMWGNSSGSYNIKSTPTMCQRLEMNNLFFLSIPGPKMIWQFGELGYDIPIDSFGRTGDKPLKWDYYSDFNRANIYNMVRTLNNLKANEPVFQGISNFTINLGGAVKTISLDSANDKVVIAGNFDVKTQATTITFPEDGNWFEFFTNDTVSVLNSALAVTLNPGEYKMYSNKKLSEKNYVITEIPKCCVPPPGLSLFPNPCNNYIRLVSGNIIKSATIISVTGDVIKSNKIIDNTLSTEELQPGAYILNIIFNDGSQKAVKLIKTSK